MAKSFKIDADVNDYVVSTKGKRSASERVNELLRHAILEEQYQRLEAEAAAFFADSRTGRQGARAFQKASIRTLTSD